MSTLAKIIKGKATPEIAVRDDGRFRCIAVTTDYGAYFVLDGPICKTEKGAVRAFRRWMQRVERSIRA